VNLRPERGFFAIAEGEGDFRELQQGAGAFFFQFRHQRGLAQELLVVGVELLQPVLAAIERRQIAVAFGEGPVEELVAELTGGADFFDPLCAFVDEGLFGFFLFRERGGDLQGGLFFRERFLFEGIIAGFFEASDFSGTRGFFLAEE
jgi:hypothetical protein